MMISWIRQIALFFSFIFLQVWIFNKINLWGVATPLFYIYFIIKIPVNTNRNWGLFLAFLLGFFIDMFSYTRGFNTLACTVIGFIRPYALNFFSPRDGIEFGEPSVKNLGKGLFVRYVVFLTLLHHITLFCIESFSFFDPLHLLLRIAGSSILTIIFILIADRLTWEKTKS
jgi:rod shape-determining protein MreD